MKKMRYKGLLPICLLLFVLLTGCASVNQASSPLDPKAPVVVTLWHSYNAYTKEVLDKLIVEFNETVGIEQGIVIDAYSYGDATELETAIHNSVNQMIGSDPQPNIFTSYPDNAYRVDQISSLVALNKYFSEDELGKYRQAFLGDGTWGEGDSIKIIPVAKSTEVLYLNKTDWDKFATATGVSLDSLRTWEGLLSAAQTYYHWSGGKALLGINPLNNFMILAAAQLGEPVYQENDGQTTFYFSPEVARKVWDVCYVPHLEGWYQSRFYCSDGVKSGNLLAYIGSSAGAGYFPKQVTIDAEQIYPIDYLVLPYPVFENGIAYAGQRGAGMCVTASDAAHEYAAAVFLKWFTEPEQNRPFTASTGYIPVENESLAEAPTITDASGGAVDVCIATTTEMLKSRQLYSRKPFDHSYAVNEIFDESLFARIQLDLQLLSIKEKKGETRQSIITEMVGTAAFNEWYTEINRQIAEVIGAK